MKLTKEIKERLRKLPTGNVADAAGQCQIMSSAIRPIDPASKIIGRACTTDCFPGDNLALHMGMLVAEAGEVLVFDCKGYTEAGHFGDMMATACRVKGLEGVIIDGSCRDSQDIRELGFPVFARAFCPRGTVKESLGKVNVPVVCGGVTVNPGDIIFGDCDGVVAVPREREDEVFDKALAKYDKEIIVREQILSGKSTMEIYGFDKLVAKKIKEQEGAGI